MRIGVISDVIYPWTKGGLEIRYYEIYKRLSKKHEVFFITMYYPGMPSQNFKYHGINVKCVCKAPKGLYKNGRRKIIPALMFSIFLLRLLPRLQLHIIDSSQTPFFPNLVLWLFKSMNHHTKIMSTWYEHWTLEYWQEYLGFIKGCIGFSLQQIATFIPDSIISISKATQIALHKIGGRTKGDLGVVWCGVDEELIHRIRERVNPHRRRLITVGRLISEKQMDKFIDFVRELSKEYPDVSAVIVGDGPEKKKLETSSKNLNIKFTGFLNRHEEVLQYIGESSIYLSFSKREGFNIAALEACQLGIPTFVILPLFSHQNIHRLDEEGRIKIREIISKGINEYKDFDSRYSWDKIAAQIEMKLNLQIMGNIEE